MSQKIRVIVSLSYLNSCALLLNYIHRGFHIPSSLGFEFLKNVSEFSFERIFQTKLRNKLIEAFQNT